MGPMAESQAKRSFSQVVTFGGLMMRHVLRAALLLNALQFGGVAFAADMPLKAPPPPAPVYYNWTGFYLGVNLGGSWGHQDATICDPKPAVVLTVVCSTGTEHMNGVIGGGQIGYNWQFAPIFGWGNGWVLGIEADFQGSGQRSSRDFSVRDGDGDIFSGSVQDKLTWFGTVRGRSGVAFDRTLWYVTGGYAYGNRTFEGTLSTTVPLQSVTFSTSKTLTGWTVGAGVEWAFWNNWTAKFEYLHIDFTNTGGDINFVNPTASISVDHLRDEVVRAGVNYKF
jgi:outer membrane immunogenic protein